MHISYDFKDEYAFASQFTFDPATQLWEYTPTDEPARHRDYVRSALDIAWHIYAVDQGSDPQRATDDQRADWLVLCARTNGFDLESDLAFTGYVTTLFDAAERYNTVRIGQHGSVADS